MLYYLFVNTYIFLTGITEGDQELSSHPGVNGDDIDGVHVQSTTLEKLGANTETFLQIVFTKWGTLCATYPWVVLFLGTFFYITYRFAISSGRFSLFVIKFSYI